MHWFLKFILGMKLHMFRTVPLSIIRSFSLYTQQCYKSYRFADSLRAGSGWNGVILGMVLNMFQTVPFSTIISSSLYTQQWYMSHRSADSLQAGSGWNGVPSWSCSQAVSKPVWFITLLCVQWRTPDDGQRNCVKHVEYHSKNNSIPSWSCSQAVRKHVWHIPLLCVQWKTPDDGQRNCPKHVEFHSKNKFEKLVHLVGFIIRNQRIPSWFVLLNIINKWQLWAKEFILQ